MIMSFSAEKKSMNFINFIRNENKYRNRLFKWWKFIVLKKRESNNKG